MLRQPLRDDLAVVTPRLGQEPDDERDAGRIDVVDLDEVEDDAARIPGEDLATGGRDRRVGRPVDIAAEVDPDGVRGLVAHLRGEAGTGHQGYLRGSRRAGRP